MQSAFLAWRYLRYALPGLPMAALGLPFYIYVPLWLAESGGYGYSVVGIIFFAARLSDVISDLAVGVWLDRFNRPRTVYLSACLLTAASALALVYLPHPWHPALLLLAIVLLMLGWTGITVPWLALPVKLAANTRDQLRYNTSREALILLGTVLAMLAPGLLTSAQLPIVLLGGLLFLLLSLLMQSKAKGVIIQGVISLKSILADHRVRSLALPWFMNTLANAIPPTILILYMREVLQAEAAVPIALLSYFAAGLVGVPFWYRLAARIGSLAAWRIALCASIVAFLGAAFLGPGDLNWFLLICIVSGLALGADQALPSALQTGLAKMMATEQPGVELSARMFALWGMLSKAAMGLAVALAYLSLGSLTDEQVPPSWAITSAYVIVPVLIKCAVIYLLAKPERFTWRPVYD
ncbi:MAG: GPH family glycoside/pentoside/hexuronide:cation symporter [Zhongshania sp.]|jgi:GPH family glycoside/pentoside/hexuronide:cation symporter